MGSFYKSEKIADKKIKAKKLRENIKILISETGEDGLTGEQSFLVNYSGGLDNRSIDVKKVSFFNSDDIIYTSKEKQGEQLEIDRYEALIDIYSEIKEFNPIVMNKYNDIFHSDVKWWYDYSDTFKQDPLIVKKMRTLQLLNRMAHEYETIFKAILYGENYDLEKTDESEKKYIEEKIKGLFSLSKGEVASSERKLKERFGDEIVDRWKRDKIIKHCIMANKWLFAQKNKYIVEVLKDLQNTNGEYNYGISDSNALIFDVPQYGQFSVHIGIHNGLKMRALKDEYGVGEYQGEYLGNVNILAKADEEKLKNVDYDSLSTKDKQRYRIACQNVREENSIDENQDEISTKDEERRSQDSIIGEVDEAQDLADNGEEQIGEHKENESSNGEHTYQSAYGDVREFTSDIIDGQQSIEETEQIINKLRETRRKLKEQIDSIEARINETILQNEEPTQEVIDDIQRLKGIVRLQSQKRKEVKEIIRNYKRYERLTKLEVDKKKDTRDTEIDRMQL